jgi:hypothetical protein
MVWLVKLFKLATLQSCWVPRPPKASIAFVLFHTNIVYLKQNTLPINTMLYIVHDPSPIPTFLFFIQWDCGLGRVEIL